ncbi:hypothetical protein SOVF_175800 [Spinacia oleracea]|nr:hypothetical protein SOVF_175800 [Spinacia oleracea]
MLVVFPASMAASAVCCPPNCTNPSLLPNFFWKRKRIVIGSLLMRPIRTVF